MSTLGKWAHSQSERFTGDFGSREEAIQDGLDYYEGENFSVGQIVHALDLVAIDVDSLIETLECQLYDVIGYEEQIVELSKPHREELKSLIEQFLRDHATFNSHGMSNIEELKFDDDPKE